jgi:tryptophanyl-tRNA synthetase
VRERYEELRSDDAELLRLLGVGAEQAREAAAPTLAAMYERMGFVRL